MYEDILSHNKKVKNMQVEINQYTGAIVQDKLVRDQEC